MIAPGQKGRASDFHGLTATFPTVVQGTGTTLSLTTDALDRVFVIVKGNVDTNSNGRTISLLYNGVTKDAVTVDGGLSGSSNLAFTLTYFEAPGAGTHNITVTANIGSISNCKIIAMKF